MSYYFDCPDCGTSVELRKRVVLNRRSCSHCGREITPEGIDQTTRARNAILAEAHRLRLERQKEAERGMYTVLGWGSLPILLWAAGALAYYSYHGIGVIDSQTVPYALTCLMALGAFAYLLYRMLERRGKS